MFRPDTLVTDVPVIEELEETFGPTKTVVTPQPTVVSTEGTTPGSSTTGGSTVEMAEGPFSGIGHRAAGIVSIYERDGEYVLRFEDDFDIQNGHDLNVWVLPSDSYDGGTPTEYLDLGKLTGNIGGQDYQLPAAFNPDLHRTVLIWCLRFSVPFASASVS